MKKKLTIIILFLFIFNMNVFASVEGEINPAWIEYMKLSEEEKSRYEAIPSQYIYNYIPKEPSNLFTFYMDYGTLGEEDDTYFNLTNVNGKNYCNTTSKNQNTLGLCWNFASTGSAESNMLIKGVKGIDEEIAKCNESNPNSIYCQYKTDKEINEKYINGEVTDNVTFSERLNDYILSKPKDSKVYNDDSANFTSILEGYNPYSINKTPGAGGDFRYLAALFNVGLAPRRTLNEWENYFTTYETKTLEEVFDSVPKMYQVTDYYFYPKKPTNETNLKKWIEDLKELIKNNGAAYVSASVPDKRSGSCHYYDKKNNHHLINEHENSFCNEPHAMQIIGWDDNYSYEYCNIEVYTEKDKNGNNYTKETCEADKYVWNYKRKECKTLGETDGENYTKETCAGTDAEYTWISGTGAWILKNSWGTGTGLINYMYPYLAYDSIINDINGVRELSVSNYDNVYNENIKNIKKITTNNTVIDNNKIITNIFEIRKSSELENLTRLNMKFNGYGQNFKIYISDNDIDYELIGNGYVDLPGLRTLDLNLKLDKENYYIKTVGNDVETINVFTKNTSTNCDIPSITTYMDKKAFIYGTNTFNIYTKTSNIKSGSQLEFRLYDENMNIIEDSVMFEENYVVNNFNNATLTIDRNLDKGKYYLVTTYENITNQLEFSIVDKKSIRLLIPEPLYLKDEDTNVEYEISDNNNVNNFRWTSSNEDVVTIDNNGKIKIHNTGVSTIKLTVNTEYGDESVSEDIIIYEETIKTVDDFMQMLYENANEKGKTYYLDNDLDFDNTTFNTESFDRQFNGVFNGGNHKLKNISIVEKDASIFNILNKATIKNVIIEDSYFEGEVSAASLAIYALDSKLEGVYVDAEIKSGGFSSGLVADSYMNVFNECVNISNIFSYSDFAHSYAGGITASSFVDIISNSYNMGKIISESNMNKIGYTATAYAAGITADGSEVLIKNSYNIGDIMSKSDIVNAVINSNGLYNSYDNSVTIENSYYLENDSYTNNIETSAKTREELMNPNTYTKWDLDNVWYLDGVNYPVLRKYMSLEVTKINIDKTNVRIGVGNKENINAIITPSITMNKNITWTSSDESVATITVNSNESVTILGKKRGVATITATSSNGKTATCEVTVKEPKLTLVEKTTNSNYDGILYAGYGGTIIIPITTQDIEENSKLTLNYYKDDVEMTNSEVSEVFKIGGNVVTDNKVNLQIEVMTSSLKGKYKIEVSSDNAEMKSFEFDVIAPILVEGIEANDIILEVDTTKKLNYTITPEEALNKNVEFSIRNKDESLTTLVAIVDEKGIVTGKQVGEAILTIEALDGSGVKKEINITVIDDFDIKTNKYFIDENLKINKINDKLVLEYFIKDFEVNSNINIKIFKNDTEIDYTKHLGTGYKLKTYSNDNLKNEYTLIVSGDLNGDGSANATDILAQKLHILNKTLLTDEYFIAGDINEDGKVNATDILHIKMYILGKYTTVWGK